MFYGILKTKADIMFDLQEYDLAIKAYKKLKDECELWEDKRMRRLKMKAFE